MNSPSEVELENTLKREFPNHVKILRVLGAEGLYGEDDEIIYFFTNDKRTQQIHMIHLRRPDVTYGVYNPVDSVKDKNGTVEFLI